MIMRDPNPYKLLTPGPLTTTLSVREAMMIDRCTWDDDYKRMTEEIRAGLLDFAHAGDDYTVVLMQGSGTFGVESVLSSVPGAKDRVLVLVNGAYSERMVKILDRHGIAHARLDFAWDEIPDAARVEAFLAEHPEVTVVSMVHNETTTGILNDIEAVGRVVKAAGRTFVVDAMSSFGAVDIRVADIGIDYLVSSANKCIQGVPGFSYIIARREALEATEGNARTVSLDLYDQWKGLEEGHGKWRFTSPTHVVAAFHRAMQELREEGGVEKRGDAFENVGFQLRSLVENAHQSGFEIVVDALRVVVGRRRAVLFDPGRSNAVHGEHRADVIDLEHTHGLAGFLFVHFHAGAAEGFHEGPDGRERTEVDGRARPVKDYGFNARHSVPPKRKSRRRS